MSPHRIIERALRIAISSALIVSCVRAADVPPRRLYELTTETGMPHLEENLRYATTHETRCLARHELWLAFPVLNHPALQRCKLGDERRRENGLTFALLCAGDSGTTGAASWQLGADRIVGTLDIKLGGKNMTLYQRITALPYGQCP